MGKYYFMVTLTRFGPVILLNSECNDVVIAIVAANDTFSCNLAKNN